VSLHQTGDLRMLASLAMIYTPAGATAVGSNKVFSSMNMKLGYLLTSTCAAP
jgi:hypothetical protein